MAPQCSEHPFILLPRAQLVQGSAKAKLVLQQLIIFSNEQNGNPLVTILVAFYLRDLLNAQKIDVFSISF